MPARAGLAQRVLYLVDVTRPGRLDAVDGERGRYLLGDRIGVGGMGEVYVARCPGRERPVAVKFLHPERVDDAHARRRFHDESLAGRVVHHPNVAAVLDGGRTADGEPFFVMEHIDGEPLGALIGREGPLAPARALAITREILAALGSVHASGIVHADIKSDNVLVDVDDRIKLIDFGLARVQFSAETAPGPDDDRWLTGTPEYMAPEVIRGEGPSFASDLYAVGVILYEMLTGTTPFGGGSPSEITARHVADEVVPPSVRCEVDLPVALDEVVVQALAKHPRDRFASADALDAALARLTTAVARAATASQPRPRRTDVSHEDSPTLHGPRRRLARGTPSYDARRRRRH